jgi:hypothetical protein
MAFKISTKSDAIAESSGFVSTSGIYDAVINFASVDVSKNGATSVNFNLNIGGNDQTIYGPYVTDKTGKDLDIGMKLINKLGVIAGLTDGDELEIEEEEHAVGKDKTVKEFAVIQQFTDLPIKIRLQEEYSINPTTNEIQQRLVIKSFFRGSDGASAEEVVSGEDIGKRLTTEQEKYATNVTYKDDLTPEAVEAWRKAGRGKSTSAAPAPKIKAKSAASSVFK